ncbi:TPA: hypothetical protein N6Z09_004296 [Escherichia coli]|nr:hypothetical protein [Escherichia coli]HCO0054796.1 hypothetical protein [Escherichia coli]
MNVTTRQSIEHRIVEKAARCLIAAGYSVEVFDGEETAQAATTDMKLIKAALYSTDEDYLMAFDTTGKRIGWVRMIYGNDGWDVMADYTTNLEDVLTDANKLADKLEEQHGG